MQLALINSDYPTGPLSREVMQAVLNAPAYWAFCWGSGLGLTQEIMRNREWVRARHVLDVGSGSGVVAIAAALAGAGDVTACDLDSDALLASQTNAELNEVSVGLSSNFDTEIVDDNSIIFLADVLYDRSNFTLLNNVSAKARAAGAELVIADSRIRSLATRDYSAFAELEARTLPNLGEFDEFKTVRLFRLKR